MKAWLKLQFDYLSSLRAVLEKFFRSIFVRIYAGLVVLCLVTALAVYLLLSEVTNIRVQSYKESLASGSARMIAEGIARQPTLEKRQNWMSDAQLVLNVDLKILPDTPSVFYQRENQRLKKKLAVVRQYKDDLHHDVYIQIPKSDQILLIQLKPGGFREQMIKALPVFILDDLVHNNTDINQRLNQIRQYFAFDVQILPIAQLNLDDDQRARIKRREVVLIYGEGSRRVNTSLTMVSPSLSTNELLRIGPIPLFEEMPQRLIVMTSIFALAIILLGVYGLILPLHRKIVALRGAVSQVTAGDLGARVETQGRDEVAVLGHSFNAMTDHVQRLINAQQELTRAVSHELRTPVARIRFGLEMMADTDDEAKRWEQQAQIDKDIQVLDELIDEILTYAKLDQGRPKLSWMRISLVKLLAQIQDETEALGKNIQLEANVLTKTVTARADYRYLHRVLQNLVGNALRYAKTQVKVSAGVQAGSAFIQVEDDGPGIPDTDYEKIFQPFSRLDDSRTRASGGYGLGLSIAAKIAYWFEGDIRVDRSPKLGGARFIMTWKTR